MNIRVLTIVIVVSFGSLHDAVSQSVNMGFNSTDSGRNITMQYEWIKRQNEFSIGLGFNFNKTAHNDDQNNIYRNRLYATKWTHHLNLDLTYQRYILVNRIEHVRPFIFYDVQAKYSTTRNRAILPYDYDSTLVVTDPAEGVLYQEVIRFYGPFTWIENTVGIGLTMDIGERIYLKQRFGIGTNFILGYDEVLGIKLFSWFDWEFATLLHFSVGMRLTKRNS